MKRLAHFLILSAALSSCWSNDVARDVEKYIEDYKKEQGINAQGTPGGTLNCSSMPVNFRCLSFNGNPTYTRYNYGAVVDSWYFVDGDWCVTLRADGTGSLKIWDNFNTVSNSTLKWGVVVNSSGVDMGPGGTSSTQKSIFLDKDNGDYSGLIALLTFDPPTGKFVAAGENRKASCPR
jgi:hypothetical protein